MLQSYCPEDIIYVKYMFAVHTAYELLQVSKARKQNKKAKRTHFREMHFRAVLISRRGEKQVSARENNFNAAQLPGKAISRVHKASVLFHRNSNYREYFERDFISKYLNMRILFNTLYDS